MWHMPKIRTPIKTTQISNEFHPKNCQTFRLEICYKLHNNADVFRIFILFF